MGRHELPEKKFKTLVLKKLRKLQEKIGIQFNKIRTTTQEQNEKFNKDIKIFLKTKTLELNNRMNYKQNVYACIVTSVVSKCCDHMDCSPPGSSVHGILQAIIPEWVAMPSSRGSSLYRD